MFKEALEDCFLQDGGAFHQRGEILDGIEPFVELRLQFLLALPELGHLEVDVGQFVVEHFLASGVHQLHLAFDVVGF